MLTVARLFNGLWGDEASAAAPDQRPHQPQPPDAEVSLEKLWRVFLCTQQLQAGIKMLLTSAALSSVLLWCAGSVLFLSYRGCWCTCRNMLRRKQKWSLKGWWWEHCFFLSPLSFPAIFTPPPFNLPYWGGCSRDPLNLAALLSSLMSGV